MDTKLRDLIDNRKMCRALVEEISHLLPGSKSGLDALFTETVANHDSPAFLYLVLAALTHGRPVDSRHLIGGAPLLGHQDWLCHTAWKMTGDVAENLVQATRRTIMTREQAATSLLIAGQWSIEHREGRPPEALISLARTMARSTEGNLTQISYLWTLAAILKDADLQAVMRSAHPSHSGEAFVEKAVAVGRLALVGCHRDLLEAIPEKPDNLVACGPHVRRTMPRIGRNDPCHCGSGQKYKRCCVDKDQNRMRHSSVFAGNTRTHGRADPETHLTETILAGMRSVELARLDVTKIPSRLLPAYFQALESRLLLDEAATAFEKLGCDSDDLQAAWHLLIQTVGMEERLEVARRMVRVQYPDGGVPGDLCFRVRLLLASDDPSLHLKLIEEEAKKALTANDDRVSMEFAYSVLHSSNKALGIHCARSVIPVIGKELASKLLHLVEVARDRTNLPPDEPFADILEKRFTEEVAHDGKDAGELRKARGLLEAKAAEVNELKESVEKLRREIRLQEKKMRAAAPTSSAPGDSEELKALREKLKTFKASITEGNKERAAYRRKLGEAFADVEALRTGQAAAATAPVAIAVDAEDALLLSGDIDGNQPPRPIEFPRRFHDTLQHLPRQIGRAALTLIGRIAAGDPAALAGAIRLKAAPDVMRVRVGQDHRMLFRLLPHSVELVDLINRRDLERRIESL